MGAYEGRNPRNGVNYNRENPSDWNPKMERGIGNLVDRLSDLGVNDSSSDNSLIQVMKAVEAAETTIKQQVEENNRLRAELHKRTMELERQKFDDSADHLPHLDASRDEHINGSFRVHQSFPSAENQEDRFRWKDDASLVDRKGALVVHRSLLQKSEEHSLHTRDESHHYSDNNNANGPVKVYPGGQAGGDNSGVSQFSSPSSRSISPNRYQRELEYDSKNNASIHGVMPTSEVDNRTSLWKQDLTLKVREHEEEILQLRKHLADFSIKEAQVLSEKYALEKRIAYMRMAFDQQQQDLVDAASKSIAYRQDIIEENIRLTYALQAAQQERSIFVSSLLPLLAEYSLQPPVQDAQSIVSNLKVLFKHLQEKLLVTEAKLKDSQYQLAPWRVDSSNQPNFAPQSPSPSIGAALTTSGVELVPQSMYSNKQIPLSPSSDGHKTTDWDQVVHHKPHTGFVEVAAKNLDPDSYGRDVASRSSAAQDTPAQFASQGESQIKRLPDEMTRKQPSFSEMLGSEMDDSDASGREPSAHWGSGNSPYLTPTHDDPNSLFSSYLLPVLEEPSSSFSEAGEDDPMPAIDSLQISGDAFPGQYLQACGYSINGTTSCNFEWVRHLEDGSVNYIDGAKQPTYLVTADDVDTYLAIEVQPLDNRKRKGELVKVFANEQRKITCDASSEGGPLLDPRRSTMWTKLDDSVKNKLILMHQMLRRGDIIWRNYSIDDEVDNVEFTALLVEDLYTNSYLSNELIDWYLFWYLKYSSDSVLMGRPSQIQSFFSLKAKAFTQYANMSDEDRIVEEYRIKRCLSIGLNASTEYLFVPMLNGPSHWTLLYLDLHDLKWHHYNSFKGTVTSRKAHKAAAEKFKKFLTSVVKPMIAKFRGVEVHKVTISPGLIVDEGAFQKNATDCGLYVCNFAKHVLMGNNQNWDDAEVYKMRREFIKGIINTPHHSWDPDNVYK